MMREQRSLDVSPFDLPALSRPRHIVRSPKRVCQQKTPWIRKESISFFVAGIGTLQGMDQINRSQVRAARALLEWTQTDLAAAAKIAVPTVKRFETGVRTPIPIVKAAIVRALEDAGVEFLPAKNGRGVGVRLREDGHG
jgi:DNA-binding XRE family transcriptional regulator